MFKKKAISKIITSSLALLIMILICIFPKENNQFFSEEIVYKESITMPIYTNYKNKYVARTNVIKTDSEIVPYIINMLTINEKESTYLPNGFIPIIPSGTTLLDYSIEGDLLKLDFSKEILNISKENEEKLIESLIYSLCELDNVNKIMILVEHKHLDRLPFSNTLLPNVLDKKYGINKKYYLNDYKNISKTTIYYVSKDSENTFYVPITKISNDTIKPVEIIIKELKNVPIYETNLISYLNASYKLKSYEILENSITLSFNNSMLYSLNDEDINEKVKYTLSLSLRDTYDINDIIINID